MERIKPITYLRYSVCVFLGDGCTDVEVKVEDNSLYCRFAELGETLEEKEWRKVSTVQTDEWNDRLEKIKIRSWNKEYNPPDGIVIMDGVEWEIHFTAGERTRHIFGNNGYPPKWNSLMKLLSEICPERDFPPAC